LLVRNNARAWRTLEVRIRRCWPDHAVRGRFWRRQSKCPKAGQAPCIGENH